MAIKLSAPIAVRRRHERRPTQGQENAMATQSEHNQPRRWRHTLQRTVQVGHVEADKALPSPSATAGTAGLDLGQQKNLLQQLLLRGRLYK